MTAICITMKKGICKKGHLINESNQYIRKDGTKSCKICAIERNKKRDSNPILYKEKLEYQKIKYHENRDIINEKNKQRWNQNKEKYHIVQRERWHKTSKEIKTDVLTYYGNGKLACICCGQEGIIFLTLDHIFKRIDGEKGSKRQNSAGIKLWRSAQIQGYPPIYQTLCWNCNVGKHINKGICPHKDTNKL